MKLPSCRSELLSPAPTALWPTATRTVCSTDICLWTPSPQSPAMMPAVVTTTTCHAPAQLRRSPHATLTWPSAVAMISAFSCEGVCRLLAITFWSWNIPVRKNCHKLCLSR
ncbi:hypothetical protein EYF80_009698 [Liparis tanakae]|uniref:Uncharacterized protein n=1 Tax=Liparis tanakae TaxID=230148 RepID=A0A4Z2IQI2_9TELE|nr:hypothetical protein EYF80_009698 [Liparis tanakae]